MMPSKRLILPKTSFDAGSLSGALLSDASSVTGLDRTKIYYAMNLSEASEFRPTILPDPLYTFDLVNKTVNGTVITNEISVERATISSAFDADGYKEFAANTPAYIDGGLQVNGSRTYAGFNNTDLTNATYWQQVGVTVAAAGSRLNVDWFDITETAGSAAHHLAATATGTATASSALWWCVVLVDAANTTGRYVQLSNRGAGAVFDLQTGAKTDCVVTASGGVTSAVGSFIREVAPGIFLLAICVNKTNANRSIIRLNIVDSMAVIDAAGNATTNGTGRKMRVALPTGCYSARKVPYPLKLVSANLLVAEDVVKISPAILAQIDAKCTVTVDYKFVQYQGLSNDVQVLLNKNQQVAPTAYVNINQSLSFNEDTLAVLPKGITSRSQNGKLIYGWDRGLNTILYGHKNINSAKAKATVIQPTTELRIGGATGQSSLFGIVTEVKLFDSLLTRQQADVLTGYSVNYAPLPNRMSGVNMAGIEFGGGPFWPDTSLYGYFANAGCKVVRLPVLWELLQPNINEVLDAGFLTTLNAQITAATNAGLKVILDPHNYAGRKLAGVDYKIGAPELPASAFSDLWVRLAGLYKNNANVIFGLMNEPTGITAEVWFPAAQAAIDAIRSTGATNLILVPGINFTSANAWLVQSATGALTITDSGNNYAFEVHSYMDTDGSGTSPNNVTAGSWGRIRDFTEWCRANGKRGFLGEWATINNEAGQFEIDAICRYMTNNSDVWLGWTWWASGSAWDANYYYLVTPTGASGSFVDRELFMRIKTWMFF